MGRMNIEEPITPPAVEHRGGAQLNSLRSAKGTMRILKLHSYLSLAALLIAAGCAQRTRTGSETEPTGARLTAAAAIRIADQAAERDGRHLGDYKSPTPRFDAGDYSCTWSFDVRVP